MPNKYIDVRINEERFCTEGIAEFSLLNMNSVRERMKRDWEEVTDDHGRKRDLCPECSKEYKKIIGGFLKKK